MVAIPETLDGLLAMLARYGCSHFEFQGLAVTMTMRADAAEVPRGPTTVTVESQSAIDLALNPPNVDMGRSDE